jgi:hypothetical protein
MRIAAVHESESGTDRRLRNVCVDGGYLGQTGPDMLNARFLSVTDTVEKVSANLLWN